MQRGWPNSCDYLDSFKDWQARGVPMLCVNPDIVVERGDRLVWCAGALAERGFPQGAWPHLHRVWIGRMVKDVRLGKQVRKAIEARRGTS